MFEKILIANRGEIAIRIMRSAKKLGIKTVAVHSEADRDAPHVAFADEAIPIGPAPSAQSYLVAERIIAAARQTGAQAIHPGYGFLSEKAHFARACEEAGIVFIGPTASAIEAMGDKIESKKLAKAAGVSTVPGTEEAVSDPAEAVAVAARIGFPVIMKASAGGGGKGMRIAHGPEQVEEGLRLAQAEARSSFGDDRVFIEKYVTRPRHIEIQVLGDAHGNVVHLCERECSLQRRHQKVIEEAPSPFLDQATRAAMGAQAVALAKAVGYRSAGTVEFIVDGDRNFYFLEMNTRLQVEHPVTEEILGLDLVEWMIRIAAGETLTLRQEDLQPKGWAVESRIYAEDPTRNFLPATGRLTRFRPPPTGAEHGAVLPAGALRIDTGVEEGSEISMYYDPMIAKLITIGKDRDEALDRMIQALDGTEIAGLGNNLGFLSHLAGNAGFRSGDFTTGLIGETYPDGFDPADIPDAERDGFLAAAAAWHLAIAAPPGGDTATLAVRWRRRNFTVESRAGAEGWIHAVNGREIAIDARRWRRGDRQYPVRRAGQADCVFRIEPRGSGLRLSHGGLVMEAQVLSPRVAALAALMPEKTPPDMSGFLLSPMPGLLVGLDVAEGDAIKAGQNLCAVEAMKMVNILKAERDVTVKQILVKPGESLSVDQKIMEFA